MPGFDSRRKEAQAREAEREVVLLATVREMARDEVLDAIPADVLEEIRREDGKPLFVALDIAQEGESTGELVIDGKTAGNQRKIWGARAIREFVRKLSSAAKNKAAKLWLGTSHEAKNSAGRIVAAFEKQVGDTMHAIAIGWVRSREAKAAFRNGSIDTGSMEADCQFERGAAGWIVRAVQKVKGVLLGDKSMRPGFAGATVLATVQELERNDEHEEEDEPMPDAPVTLGKAKLAISENGWNPSQLFGGEALLGDGTVADALKSEVDAKVAAAVGEKDKEIDGLKADAEAHRAEQRRRRVEELVEKSELLKDEPKGKAAFIRKHVRVDLAGVAEDKMQETVDAAVKAELGLLGDGVTFADPAGGENRKQETGDANEEEDEALPASGAVMHHGKDMTDPVNNPQIPKIGG